MQTVVMYSIYPVDPYLFYTGAPEPGLTKVLMGPWKFFVLRGKKIKALQVFKNGHKFNMCQ